MDEWVAYARNLVSNATLPAGTFDSQVSFAQALTEAVKQVPNALLLISVPQSVNEIGGSDGEKAVDSLKNVVTRLAYQWRPATGNEGFEIVRRRLFEPITTKEAGAARDAVVRSFTDLYSQNPSEFPAETREAGYRDLLISAYPIHPELFKRLYDDWSTLDRFQRTRGVLRLLALTIEGLWNGNSKDLLIMPSSIPLDDNDVKNELVRFLDNQWEPIISQDVDGPQSTPTRLDIENPNFGRVSACKRVARSLYIGTAPDADALRRLGDRGRFIQQDGDRYWLDTRPNLNRTAEEHRESYLRQREELLAELNTRMAQEASKRGAFAGLHAAPLENSAVPDDAATRLVLLAAQHTHRRGVEFSAARQWAAACLQSRGNSPRQFTNTLIFLAPDEASLENLFHALADRRAWHHIIDNELELNLTVAQKNQAIGKIAEATQAVASRIPETWCHLLIPYQSQPGPGGALWDEKKLTSGKGSLAERASERCVQEDLLFQQLGARRLRDDLNRFLWTDKPHIAARDLVDWCRKYLYLPRVATDQVILDALVNPQAALTGEATFHLADGLDEGTGRYIGLRPQQDPNTGPATLKSLVVKDEVAPVQIEANRLAEEERKRQASKPEEVGGGGTGPGIVKPDVPKGGGHVPPAPGPTAPATPQPGPVAAKLPTTYTASVKLESVTAGPQVGKFLDEVMSHLQALPGVNIAMTLEVQVRAPGGIDEATARIVLENSAALKVEKPGLY